VFLIVFLIYTLWPKTTSHFIIRCNVNVLAPVCIKFIKWKEETLSYKTLIVILKLFHFYLRNISNKSDTVILDVIYTSQQCLWMWTWHYTFSDEDRILNWPLIGGRFDNELVYIIVSSTTTAVNKDIRKSKGTSFSSTCCSKPSLFGSTFDIQPVRFRTTQS